MDEKELEKQIVSANKKVEQLLTIMEAQQLMIAKNAEQIKKQESQIAKYKRELADFVQNIRYELTDQKEFSARYWYPKIMDQQLTMKQLVEQRRSFVRFTETELDMLIRFMEVEPDSSDEDDRLNIELRNKLLAILKEDNERCIVALPNFFGSLDNYHETARRRFRDYLTEERRQKIMKLLPQHKNYHDAIMIHPNEYDEFRSGIPTMERFRMLTAIWSNKRVVAVTAPGNGLTADNPFFKTVSEFISIEVPVTDALQDYDRIFKDCIYKQGVKTVYLVAAGPMGVVLAADLCKEGFQAIDIGTLGKQYLEFREKAGGKKHVPS